MDFFILKLKATTKEKVSQCNAEVSFISACSVQKILSSLSCCTESHLNIYQKLGPSVVAKNKHTSPFLPKQTKNILRNNSLRQMKVLEWLMI